MTMTRTERAAARAVKKRPSGKVYTCISCDRTSTDRLDVCRSTDAAAICTQWASKSVEKR